MLFIIIQWNKLSLKILFYQIKIHINIHFWRQHILLSYKNLDIGSESLLDNNKIPPPILIYVSNKG